jgi:hypothetical protein
VNRSLLNVVALGSLLLAAFAACGDDDDDDKSPEKPAGPPSLRISGFIGADHRVLTRSDENELEICEERLGVVVEIPENTWSLRPPGRCTGILPCGYVNVNLLSDGGDALVSTNSLNLTTMLDLTGRPVFENAGGATGEGGAGGAPGTVVSEGHHRVRVELRNPDGSTFRDAAGEPVADEAEVELTFVPCSPSGAGGSGQGGAPGAGGPASGAGGSGDAGAAGALAAGGQGGAGFGGEGGVSPGGAGAGLGGAG